MQEGDQILFEKYFSGALNAEEQRSFEDRLASEPRFKEDYDLYTSMQGYLDDRVKHGKALENIRSVHSEQSVKRKKKPNWFYYVSAAASLLILAGAISFFISKPTTVQYADLYQEPDWPLERSGKTNVFLRAAALRVDEANYDEALTILKNSDLGSDEKNYWVAEVFAKQSKADSILHYLPQAYQTQKRRDRINYLKAIALFKSGKSDELRVHLDSLPQDTGSAYNEIYNRMR